MKKFRVQYAQIIYYETHEPIEAETEDEALAKATEILGEVNEDGDDPFIEVDSGEFYVSEVYEIS